MVTENIEGRERYPVNVRYSRDFRDNVDELRRVLIGTPSGAQIPIEEVARISFSRGPAMIRDEDGALTGHVYIDLNSRNYGDFVNAANDMLKQKLHLPAGYTSKWAGEYEFELRAKERLQVILPVVFFVIFVLLYMVFHSIAESAVLICNRVQPRRVCAFPWWRKAIPWAFCISSSISSTERIFRKVQSMQ